MIILAFVVLKLILFFAFFMITPVKADGKHSSMLNLNIAPFIKDGFRKIRKEGSKIKSYITK